MVPPSLPHGWGVETSRPQHAGIHGLFQGGLFMPAPACLHGWRGNSLGETDNYEKLAGMESLND
jgi:hypothetical protein